jgi:hypothetical protein
MDQVLGVSAKGGEMSLQGPRLACVFVQQQDQLRVRGRPGNVLGGEEFETVSEQRYQNNTRLTHVATVCTWLWARHYEGHVAIGTLESYGVGWGGEMTLRRARLPPLPIYLGYPRSNRGTNGRLR